MAGIILLRHGKSDWDADFDHDRDRPLSRRGERAAATMGTVLALAGEAPDLVLSSPARRATETAAIAARTGGWEARLEIVPDLYGGGSGAVLAAIRAVPSAVGRVLLVGHEPTWSAAVALLAGGGDHRMPTAAAAGLTRPEGGWPDTAPGGCRLLWLLPPRLFTDGGLMPPPAV
jgi:phosphohistidine phosphatase